jgi:hypothetical protein
MKTRITCIKITPEILDALNNDTRALALGRAAYPAGNMRMAYAFSFGYRFGAYAKGMTTWEIDAAASGWDAKQVEIEFAEARKS